MIVFIKNFFIALISGGIAFFFILSSFVFGQKSEINAHDLVKNNTIKKYVLSEGIDENTSAKTLVYHEIQPTEASQLDKNSVLYVDFGRLSSAFILPRGTGGLIQNTDVLSLSGKEVTLLENYPTIISLYDPFSIYTLRSKDDDFSIEQVTNGSFYVGRESNNTISLYSIDAVMKLNFLSQGEHMADIVLFPGMYVRFNPTFNHIFKGVTDPFRVAQVVGSDDNQDSSLGTTGIEFINPRMEISGNADTFFVYRLPASTRILFQMLHAMFNDKVAQIDIMKAYASNSVYGSDLSSSPWLKNPSKINHFLLLELKGILSQGLQSQTTFEAFTRKVSEIRKRANVLAIGNSVNATFEEFLTNGRFALFNTTVTQKYDRIYQEVASIVGITPTTGKAQLFQKLSDIYSLNLVARRKDLAFSKIDTYSPTASELQLTLDSTDIGQKDFFDIALYAYSLLEKAKDGQMFEPQALTAHATYQLLSTLFISTSKYASSVEDIDQRAKTYRSIAINFYDPMLRVLSQSLFSYYTHTDDKGHIFLNDKALNTEGKIRIARELIRDIKAIDNTSRGIVAEAQTAYTHETDTKVLISMKQSALRIRAFASLLADDVYLNYQLSPYRGVQYGNIYLPQLTYDNNSVVVDSLVPEDESSTTQQQEISSDSSVSPDIQ